MLFTASNLVTNLTLQTLDTFLTTYLVKTVRKTYQWTCHEALSCYDLFLSKAIRIQTKPLLPHSLNRTDRHLAIRNQHKQIMFGLVHWFANAFDVINHDVLLRKLTLYGLLANTLSWVAPSSTAASKRFPWKINIGFEDSFIWSSPRIGPRTSPVLHLYKRPTFTCPFCTMWHVSRWHDNSHLWAGCTCNNMFSSHVSLLSLNGHIWIISLNPSKTKHMILTTRQKRQLLHSPSAHLSVGNQQITELSDHKQLTVTIIWP